MEYRNTSYMKSARAAFLHALINRNHQLTSVSSIYSISHNAVYSTRTLPTKNSVFQVTVS